MVRCSSCIYFRLGINRLTVSKQTCTHNFGSIALGLFAYTGPTQCLSIWGHSICTFSRFAHLTVQKHLSSVSGSYMSKIESITMIDFLLRRLSHSHLQFFPVVSELESVKVGPYEPAALTYPALIKIFFPLEKKAASPLLKWKEYNPTPKGTRPRQARAQDPRPDSFDRDSIH